MELVLVGIVSFGILYIIFSYWKASQNRKNALLIIRTSLLTKIMVVITASFAIKIKIESLLIHQSHLLYSLIFIGFFLSLLLVPYTVKVIFKEDGIYFHGPPFIPWDIITKISFNFFYWHIEVNRRLFRLFFLKRLSFIRMIWKFTPQDIQKIQALVDKKKRLRKRSSRILKRAVV